MKKTLLLTLLLSLFAGGELFSQTFYETAFASGGVTYESLIIFYEDNDIVVRTKYTSNGEYRVAEYRATAGYRNTTSGEECYMISGDEASVVYGTGTYSADNYIFYQENGSWGDPYAIDDNGLSSSDPQNAMTRVKYWREVDPAVSFTQKYVYNYFQPDEPLYATLLSYNAQNASDVAGNGGGEWKVFMDKGRGYGLQSWMTRKEWPADDIRDYWGKGKMITEVSYGDGVWSITMSEKSGYSRQAWKHSVGWPDEWIEEKWADDFRITDIAYGNGHWAVVMAQGTGLERQKYVVSKKWPKEWLDREWKPTNYHINELAYGASHWVMCISYQSGYNPGQRIRAGEEFPVADVQASQNEGYAVTSTAYGDEWVAILTRDNGVNQRIGDGESFPKSFISETWDLGYSISEAVYSNRENDEVVVMNFVGEATSYGGTVNSISSTPSYAADNTPSQSNPNSTTTVLTEIPKMHLVVVANTKVPDIGVSCMVDRDNVADEFTDIAAGLDIELKKYMIDGENLSRENVERTLAGLRPGANDIVVFAYTGHGFRWSNQSSRYPMMALFYSRFDGPSNANSLNLEEVYQTIVSKGARLNIVMGDCCNNDIGITSREGGGSLASRSFSRGSSQRLRKLFFEARGNIMATAAQPGETACGSRITGGYFLNAFFSAIDKEVSLTTEGSPSWESIMRRTMSSSTYKTQNLNGCSAQHGIYKNLTR